MSSIIGPKHKCTFAGCQFSFTKRNHLERHWKTHTQSQDYSCPTCQRRFSRLDSRNRHIQRVHTGVTSGIRVRQSKVQSSTSGQTHSNQSELSEQSGQSRRDEEENPEEQDEDNDETYDESMEDVNDGPPIYNQGINTDGHGPDDAAYYGAAEQLSRLRHQPSVSSESTSRQGRLESSNSSNNILTVGSSTDITSASFGIFNSIDTTTSPSNASFENNDLLLDFDPMMTSLLWNTLEASITEASGPSYMNPIHRPSGAGDHSAIFDLLTWQGKSPVLGYGRTGASGHQDQVDAFPSAGAEVNQRRDSVAPTNGYRRKVTMIPADQQQQQQHYEATSSTALNPEAEQMASQMKSDLNSMMGHIEAPIEPEKGLASSCFWLCRRHFLPTSVLTAPQRMSKVQDDGNALVMNLIAIGSLWHHNQVVRKWGTDIWSFTLRIVWSRGMRNVQDDATVSMLMSILLSGHSYVLMSSDPTVHSLGRRAWLFCHLLHDNRTHRSLKNAGDAGVEEDLESFLNQATYRAELRNNASLLNQTWNRWKQMEGGIRVAWGIRLYDSQQAAWLDMIPALQADVSLKYPEPASEKLLEAKTAQDWLNRYEVDTPKRRDLVSIMKLLHRPFPCSSQQINWSSSQQADYNIIETIYSSWQLDNTTLGKTSEYWNMAAQRLPQELGLLRSAHALANWRLFWGATTKERERGDIYCLLIRWHCVHMNFGLRDVDLVDYVREQTRHLAKQDEATEVLQIPRKQSRCTAEDFYYSPRGRRTLWHAGRISAELSRLPRVTSTPLHVAQAAYESTLVLVAFALIAKQKQDVRQGKAFEVVGGQHDDYDDDQWIQLGLAGFLISDTEAYSVDSSAQTDWGSQSSNSAARRWILNGETQDTTISGLPIQQCSMALQDVNRALEQSLLLWCLAADYQNLINRGLSLL